MTAAETRRTDAPKDSDTFRLSLRGACLVAADAYQQAFGPAAGDAIETAERMFRRLDRAA